MSDIRANFIIHSWHKLIQIQIITKVKCVDSHAFTSYVLFSGLGEFE
jgi:hypothetical protein